MKIDRKKISGLSLLEALVSTAIIGIGFVAIFQMTNYSVQSIYTSGERTCLLYTSPSPRDAHESRMPSSA